MARTISSHSLRGVAGKSKATALPTGADRRFDTFDVARLMA